MSVFISHHSAFSTLYTRNIHSSVSPWQRAKNAARYIQIIEKGGGVKKAICVALFGPAAPYLDLH